jgi:hypothetical protein
VIERSGDWSFEALAARFPVHVRFEYDRDREKSRFAAVQNYLERLRSAAPVALRERRNGIDYVIRAFADARDADAFIERFGGELVIRELQPAD